MARNLTDKGVAALKAQAKAYSIPDPQLPGHMVRVQPTGNKSFVTVTRDPRGKQIWTTIGSATSLTVEDARQEAKRVSSGSRPERTKPVHRALKLSPRIGCIVTLRPRDSVTLTKFVAC